MNDIIISVNLNSDINQQIYEYLKDKKIVCDFNIVDQTFIPDNRVAYITIRFIK